MQSVQDTNFDSWEEAVKYSIHAAGKSLKEVAVALWPSDKRAYEMLREALSSAHKKKLSLDEIIFICNYCNRFDALDYMANLCDHNKPTRKTEEQSVEAINRSIIEAKKMVEKSEIRFAELMRHREKKPELSICE